MAAPARFEKERLPVVARVRSALAEAGCSPGDRVLVAVSAGPDSSALLEILAGLPQAQRPVCEVAYVDHGVHPERHREEAEHVRAHARHLHLEFHLLQADNPRGARDEAFLRELRQRALEDCAWRAACRWIATGHTLEDQIETVLFRLLRGSGRLGMSAMAVRRGRWIRPLLGIRRAELKAVLERAGVSWRRDPSNHDMRYARNRLRARLLPFIEEEIGAGGLERLARAARRWRAEEELLEELAAREYAYAVREGEVDLVALRSAPPVLRSRVLRRWLRESGATATIESDHVEALQFLLDPSGGLARVDLPGLSVLRSGSRLRVCAPARAAHAGGQAGVARQVP